MPLENNDDVIAALRTARDDELTGTFETTNRDFKGEPYRLDETKQKWELAKDVVALANVGGGILVLGVSTTKHPVRNEDVADQLRPFQATMFDSDRYGQVIGDHSYPRLQDVTCELLPRDDGKALALIVVPAQDHDRGPFLMKRVVDDGDAKINAFALPRRDGAHTVYEDVGLIHRDIADGRRSRSLASGAALGGAASTSSSATADLTVAKRGTDRLRDEIAAAEELADWNEFGALYLVALPPPDIDLIDTFLDAQSGILGALSDPVATIRHAGFSLTYGLDVRLVGGAIWSIESELRLVSVQRDGFMLAGAAGTADFLGWSQHPRDPLEINPVVLVEWVLEFVRFVAQHLKPHATGGDWRLGVAGRRLMEGAPRLGLRPGARFMRQMPPPFGPPELASSDEFNQILKSTTEAVDAYRALQEIYLAFGLSGSDIPFAENGEVTVHSFLRGLSK